MILYGFKGVIVMGFFIYGIISFIIDLIKIIKYYK